MKIWNFVKWQWKKMEFWMKSYVFAMIALVTGVLTDPPTNRYFFAVGIGILFFWNFKWFIVDTLSESWSRFKKEQETLFLTIRDSDKK